MKADRNFYLTYRPYFIMMNLYWEVKQLDIHFNVNIIYNKQGQTIKII